MNMHKICGCLGVDNLNWFFKLALSKIEEPVYEK